MVLRLAIGLSAEETAQAIRSTPGTVRVTQHRALGRLRKILLGQSGGRGDPGLEELDIDPDVAAADDSTIDAMARRSSSGTEPEPVVPGPGPAQAVPVQPPFMKGGCTIPTRDVRSGQAPSYGADRSGLLPSARFAQ